jgi:hypothetical protein
VDLAEYRIRAEREAALWYCLFFSRRRESNSDENAYSNASRKSCQSRIQYVRKRKLMDLAISWLEIIGGVLLGGFCLGLWFGGYKSAGLWTGTTGAVMFIVAFALQIQQSIWQAEHTEPPFNVTWQPVFIDMGPNQKNIGMFVTYHNGVMSPIRVITQLTITNLQPVQSTIKTYLIQGASESNGPWVTIPTVDSWANVYALANGLALARKIDMGQTAFNFKVLNHLL